MAANRKKVKSGGLSLRTWRLRVGVEQALVEVRPSRPSRRLSDGKDDLM